MRVGVRPTSLLEWVATHLNLVPIPAAEVLFCMLHSRILMAGTQLGVFEALGQRAATAQELAERLRLEPTGTRLLCEALVAGRYLMRDRAGHYRLTAVARRYLTPRSRHYVGHYVSFNYDQWDWADQLEDVVRSGRTIDLHHALGHTADGQTTGSWARYLEGLAELAREAAGEIAANVPLSPRRGDSPRRLLDIGGGHGVFSAALCRRYPDLVAEILELPEAIAVGEALARRYAGPAADRIHYRAGDALSDSLGPEGTFDGVLIFQLLHHLPPAAIPQLFVRAVSALRPGGWISIIDLLERPRRERPDPLSAYTALYFHLTSRGESYTPEQVEGWLAAAGCAEVRHITLLRVPGQPLIVGRRPPD